jgi:hypothetical protein
MHDLAHAERREEECGIGGPGSALFVGEGRVRKMMKVAVTPLDVKSRLSR